MCINVILFNFTGTEQTNLFEEKYKSIDVSVRCEFGKKTKDNKGDLFWYSLFK